MLEKFKILFEISTQKINSFGLIQFVEIFINHAKNIENLSLKWGKLSFNPYKGELKIDDFILKFKENEFKISKIFIKLKMLAFLSKNIKVLDLKLENINLKANLDEVLEEISKIEVKKNKKLKADLDLKNVLIKNILTDINDQNDNYFRGDLEQISLENFTFLGENAKFKNLDLKINKFSLKDGKRNINLSNSNINLEKIFL